MAHHEQHCVIDILRNTEIAHKSLSDCCIFRVQNHLREVNNAAYEPNIIAIGPYHSGKKEYLELMEGHKQRYLQNLLDRKNHDMQNYIRSIASVFEEVRKCYAEPLDDYGPDKLVLDGCFIIELLRKSSNVVPQEENDPIFMMEWIVNSLERDLLLFENQIPFFIICMLFDMTKDEGSNVTFTRLARDFFRNILPGVGREDRNDIDDPNKCKHLLGLIHTNWLPLFTKVRSNNEEQEIGWLKKILIRNGLVHLPIFNESVQDKIFATRVKAFKYIPCVTDLKKGGIKFEKGDGNMFNIRFENRTIIIPPFIVEKRTESFFRNLIAHEQYRQGTNRHFVTDYAKFMHCLINSPSDVGSLRRLEIINNWLGGDEVVSTMFNTMTDSVVASDEFFHYRDVFNELDNIHLQRVIVITGASVALLLTAVQTIFTIIG